MPLRGWWAAFGFLSLVLSQTSIALESRFASGLLRQFAADDPEGDQGEARAVSEFLDREYGAFRPDFSWRRVSRFVDKTHTHLFFALQYRGRAVENRNLKVHYNRRGFIEYASSDWSVPISVSTDAESGARLRERRREISQAFADKFGRPPGRLELRPVIWVSRDSTRATPAFEVVLGDERRGIFRTFFIDEKTGTNLQEKITVRFAEAFRINPDAEARQTVTLPGLAGGATTLSSSYFHVRRDEISGGTSTLREVDPTANFSGTGGYFDDPTPAQYAANCTGSTATSCPNQGFEAVNVYYHLESFRERLRDYFTALGATVTLPADPLPVIVNSLSVDVDGDGDGSTEANNAAYIAQPCRDSEPAMTRCLVFLQPAAGSSATCGDGIKQFFSVAREAVVVVHEYQHYVTDSLTGMTMGQTQTNVGDALHEGFSDYFAASHVSQLVGSSVTAVGAYAFQNCSAIIRDIGTVKVYDKDSLETGPHYYGWSWASGLWKLRQEVGATVMDKIALKSLFLLSTTPGFMDAVEALVQADKALNNGANAARIREVFYDEVKFIGGETGQFRDIGAGVIEMGLRSCAFASARATHSASAGASGAVLVAWLWGLMIWGRKRMQEER